MILLKWIFFFLQSGGYVGSELRKADGDFLPAMRIRWWNIVYYEHPDRGWIKGISDWFSKIQYKNIPWGPSEITVSMEVK